MNQVAETIEPIVMTGIPRIGAEWKGQGGINGGLVRGENGPDYFLILPTAKLAQVKRIEFGSYGKKVAGADSLLDGLANTRALLASGLDHPLAKWASELVVEGFSDLYIPSITELAVLRAAAPDQFENDWYWSSTQYSASLAWVQVFVSGTQNDAYKSSGCRGVAVRRLVLQVI